MHEDDLKTLLPNAVDHRLSSLEGDPWLAQRIIRQAKGEPPVMKKKLSVSLAMVLVIMLLTISAAVALVNSNIADHLFGSREAAPPEVMDILHTPAASTATDLGMLTVDEWLYDGASLHTSFTIANPSDQSLLYTLEGIWLNGEHVSYDQISTGGAGDSGLLLGGELAGTTLPRSHAVYSKSGYLILFDENGKYAGPGDLPLGTSTLKIAIAVWQPINPVELVDYNDYEGFDATESKDHLTADSTGRSNLWMFRSLSDGPVSTARDLPSQVYGEYYRSLGWMELAEVIEVELPITLDNQQAARAIPTRTILEQNDCRIELTRFDMTHAGGMIEGWIYGDYNAVKSLIGGGLEVVDEAGQRVLSNGCWWDDQPADAQGMHFAISVAPFTGELPQEIHLAHIAAVDNRWDEDEPCYDPTLEKPENVIGIYQIDYTNAIVIPLTHAN